LSFSLSLYIAYDKAMGIWGDKSKNSTDAPLISPNLIELLHNIDEEFLIIAPGEVVVASSPGVAALGVVKESTVTSFPLLNLIRTSRRNKERLEETIELPRGPIGGGTRELLVRVAPLGEQDLMVVLIFDDSEFNRLNSMRRDFVANISHELKTPIGALSILSEAVLEASNDPEAIKNFASRMQIEATRLSDLVQEIINLSQLQDVDPLKNAAIWNLSSVVQDAIDESRLAADKRQIEIVFQEIDPCFALGDRSQLLMAVSNLIENAINYSSSGTRVGISISHNGSLSEISVTDQGVGIPERDLERIFERFYRVDPARSRETGGTGLGLSIVKHVAANHGGDITVWSLEGHGSTFTIRLPYLSDENDQSSKGGAE
jgi:two-component system sensor histidine kinase SenX3